MSDAVAMCLTLWQSGLLTALPDEIGMFKGHRLDFSGNKLTTLPEPIFNLSQVPESREAREWGQEGFRSTACSHSDHPLLVLRWLQGLNCHAHPRASPPATHPLRLRAARNAQRCGERDLCSELKHQPSQEYEAPLHAGVDSRLEEAN
eukprot:SAG11_NODE_4904_length_1727_cov_1.605037_2_plen_148_part_00